MIVTNHLYEKKDVSLKGEKNVSKYVAVNMFICQEPSETVYREQKPHKEYRYPLRM